MYHVMENNTDVVILEDIESSKEWVRAMGFKFVGMRKTYKGAERLAEKRCEL